MYYQQTSLFATTGDEFLDENIYVDLIMSNPMFWWLEQKEYYGGVRSFAIHGANITQSFDQTHRDVVKAIEGPRMRRILIVDKVPVKGIDNCWVTWVYPRLFETTHMREAPEMKTYKAKWKALAKNRFPEYLQWYKKIHLGKTFVFEDHWVAIE